MVDSSSNHPGAYVMRVLILFIWCFARTPPMCSNSIRIPFQILLSLIIVRDKHRAHLTKEYGVLVSFSYFSAPTIYEKQFGSLL